MTSRNQEVVDQVGYQSMWGEVHRRDFVRKKMTEKSTPQARAQKKGNVYRIALWESFHSFSGK